MFSKVLVAGGTQQLGITRVKYQNVTEIAYARAGDIQGFTIGNTWIFRKISIFRIISIF